MPDSVKIDLVNEMAREPAAWSAMNTMTKTETKISTARHELAKNPNNKRKVVLACKYTHAHTHTHTHTLAQSRTHTHKHKN